MYPKAFKNGKKVDITNHQKIKNIPHFNLVQDTGFFSDTRNLCLPGVSELKNFSCTAKLGDKKRLDIEQPGNNSEPFPATNLPFASLSHK